MAQAQAPQTKKVGQPIPANPEVNGDKKVKKEKVVKPALPVELCVDSKGTSIVNAEGLFTGVPVKWTKAFRKLREKNFIDEAVYLEFKAWLVEQSVAKELNRVKELREEALQVRKSGDNPKIRKTVKRVKKMREALKDALAALEAEGITL